ncbi:hypothetical protein ACFWP7_35330 [Streptomyces sp. NPDC058470]
MTTTHTTHATTPSPTNTQQHHTRPAHKTRTPDQHDPTARYNSAL